jgi:hypothetical protein
MPEIGNGTMAGGMLLAEETKKYLESHPDLIEKLQRAEKVYRIFGAFLNLTQPRIILRENGGSNAEVDLSAALSRANS